MHHQFLLAMKDIALVHLLGLRQAALKNIHSYTVAIYSKGSYKQGWEHSLVPGTCEKRRSAWYTVCACV